MKLMKLAKIFVSGVNGPSSGDLVLVCVQWPHSNDPGDNGAVWAAQNIFSINTPRFHNIGNSFNTQKYLKRTTSCCCLSYTILTISERICATAWWGWLVVAEGGIYFTYIQWGFEGREGGKGENRDLFWNWADIDMKKVEENYFQTSTLFLMLFPKTPPLDVHCQLISNNQVKTLIVANIQTQFVKTLTDVWRLITRIISNVYKHYHHHKYQRLQLTLTLIPSLILSQH